MRKITIWGLILIICSMIMTGCTKTVLLSYEQSKKNYSIYLDNVKSMFKKYHYNYEIKKVVDEDEDVDDPGINAAEVYVIEVDKRSKIEIILVNFTNNHLGSESVDIYYNIQLKDLGEKHKYIDIDLFVRLIQCMSDYNLTPSICQEFLNASEEKYSADKYGETKEEDMLISKVNALNFLEDYWVSYDLTKDMEETFHFGGLTKQLQD